VVNNKGWRGSGRFEIVEQEMERAVPRYEPAGFARLPGRGRPGSRVRYGPFAVCLKAYPDTNREFFSSLWKPRLFTPSTPILHACTALHSEYHGGAVADARNEPCLIRLLPSFARPPGRGVRAYVCVIVIRSRNLPSGLGWTGESPVTTRPFPRQAFPAEGFTTQALCPEAGFILVKSGLGFCFQADMAVLHLD